MSGHYGGKSVLSAEQKQDEDVAALNRERRNGPAKAIPWEPHSCAERPMVAETAIFVSSDLVLSGHSESLSNVRLNTKSEITRAVGLAAWLQIVSQGFAGKIGEYDHSNATIKPQTTFQLRRSNGPTNVRSPKVHVDMIAVLKNATEKPTAENVRGFILRAMALDWEFSFSDALAWTVCQNRMMHEPPSNNPSDATKLMATFSNGAGEAFLLAHIPREQLYAIVLRPVLYRPALLEWADMLRRSVVENIASEMREKAIRAETSRRVKLAKERRDEKKRKERIRAKGGAAAAELGDDDDDDDMEIDLDGPVELSPEKEARIRNDALLAFEADRKIPINEFMDRLSMTSESADTRLNNAHTLSIASLSHVNRLLPRPNADPKTADEVLDSLAYRMRSYWLYISYIGISYCRDTAALDEAKKFAASLDNRTCVQQNIRETALAPERMFTLENALKDAEDAGGDKAMLYLEDYYATYDDPMAIGPAYDPNVLHSTVTFHQANIEPMWGRTMEEQRRLEQNATANEYRMSPWYGRVRNAEATWPIATANVPFNRLRLFCLPFAKDDFPDLIQEVYQMVCSPSRVQNGFIASVRMQSAVISGGELPIPDPDVAQEFTEAGDDERMDSPQTMVTFSHILDYYDRHANADFTEKNDGVDRLIRARNADREHSLRAQIVGLPAPVERIETSEFGMHQTYHSNFTLARKALEPIDIKMRLLFTINSEIYQRILPRYRAYCMRFFSRVYTAGAYNNGMAMKMIREHEKENWNNGDTGASSGAYRRVNDISGVLSPFGNFISGLAMSLSVIMNATVGIFLLVDMLVAMRPIAFDNLSPKLHQLIWSMSGDGKSRLISIFRSMTISGSTRESMHTSLLAGLDTLAQDDEIHFSDEAPHSITHSNDVKDPKDAQADSILKTRMTQGVVSAQRNVRGKFTETFEADNHCTIAANTNRVEKPRDDERSMLMRMQIRMIHDDLRPQGLVYRQHQQPPVALSNRQSDFIKYGQDMQALAAIIVKQIYLHALPPVDSTMVSLLLEPLMSQIDRYYPRWMEFMRASRRVEVHCLGYAISYASYMAFNAPLSEYSPERNKSGRNPGFDPAHTNACMPYLFVTSEMVLMSLLWTLDEAVPLSTHMMMYALATKAEFAMATMEHLFAHGGRDHKAKFADDASKDTLPCVTDMDVAISQDMIEASKIAVELLRMSVEERLRRDQAIIMTSQVTVDGIKMPCNRRGDVITNEMRQTRQHENDILKWWNSLTAEQQELIKTGSATMTPRYKIGGWRPEHWDRIDETMPSFWKHANQMLLAMEQRNNCAYEADRNMCFAEAAVQGQYDPNYIRVHFPSGFRSSGATRVQEAMDCFPISQQNWQAVLDYATDPKATSIVLPRLAIQTTQKASHMRWLVDASGTIVTKRTQAIHVVDKADKRYIDISTVWLFTCGVHNHQMTLLTALEDKYVPVNGRHMLLPISDPSTPSVLLSFKMQRRAAHVIQLPNPSFVGTVCSNAALHIIPAADIEVAIAAQNAKARAEGRPEPLSMMSDNACDSIAYQAACTILGRLTRDHSFQKQDRHPEQTELVLAKAKTSKIVYSTVSGKNPLDLLDPANSVLTFDSMSVDEALYQRFISTTAQEPKTLAATELAFHANSVLTTQMLESTNDRARKLHVKLQAKKKKDDEANKKDASADEYLNETEKSIDIIAAHVSMQQNAALNYPDPFLTPGQLAWLARNKEDAKFRAASSNKSKKTETIPVPPIPRPLPTEQLMDPKYDFSVHNTTVTRDVDQLMHHNEKETTREHEMARHTFRPPRPTPMDMSRVFEEPLVSKAFYTS